MRLLVLGGTEFVGRAVVDAALGRGWEVTVLNRGLRPAPAGARTVRGDRSVPGGLDGLDAVTGAGWDHVVDTWRGAPRAVRDAARRLRGRAGRYAYVSSCSVYDWAPPAGYTEDAPVVGGAAPDAESTDYARDKRGGELAAVEAFGADRALLARPGLILGPHENVGRLPWWLARVARGGPLLAPGPRELPLRYIDARDLAAWTLGALERGASGPFNLVCAEGHLTMGGLLDACVEVTGSDAEPVWTPPGAVLDAGIAPWTELPVWVAPGGPEHDALHAADVSRALGAGLVCRPFTETVADTWAWLGTLGDTPPPRAAGLGLDPAKEARVLAGRAE